MTQLDTKYRFLRTFQRRVRPAALVVIAALLAAACTASTTIQPAVEVAAAQPTAASEAQPTPAFVDPTPSVLEPTAVAETPATEPSPDDEAPTPEPSSVDALPGSVEVLLLDSGAEPRAELRMVIAASCGEILTAEQNQSISQTIGGTPLPSGTAVGTIVETAVTVQLVGENYDIRSEIISAIAAPGTDPAIASAMNPELAATVGLTTSATLTDRGVQIPDSLRVEGAESLGPLQQTVEALGQIQAPLPLEPVGVGAVWRTTSIVDFEGVDLINTTTYRITEIDGTVLTMAIEGTQEVPTGSELVLEGLEVEVVEWTGSSTGESIIDLATISPIISTVTGTATQSLDFGAAGGLLEQEILTDIPLSGQPNDGCIGRTIRP